MHACIYMDKQTTPARNENSFCPQLTHLLVVTSFLKFFSFQFAIDAWVLLKVSLRVLISIKTRIKRTAHTSTCLSVSLAVMRHHDHGISYKRKHLIGAGLSSYTVGFCIVGDQCFSMHTGISHMTSSRGLVHYHHGGTWQRGDRHGLEKELGVQHLDL